MATRLPVSGHPARDVDSGDDGASQELVGLVVGGVGVASLAVGMVFGILRPK